MPLYTRTGSARQVSAAPADRCRDPRFAAALHPGAAEHVKFRRRKRTVLRMTRDGKAVHDDQEDQHTPLAMSLINSKALEELRRSVRTRARLALSGLYLTIDTDYARAACAVASSGLYLTIDTD
ncbi:MAG: hypothetical protein ACK56I_29970, partial [bacterium]